VGASIALEFIGKIVCTCRENENVCDYSRKDKDKDKDVFLDATKISFEFDPREDCGSSYGNSGDWLWQQLIVVHCGQIR
jgi:hypothetical protein